MFRKYLKGVMWCNSMILLVFLRYVKYKTIVGIVSMIFMLIVLLLTSAVYFNVEKKLFKEIEDDYKNGEISEGAFAKIKKVLHGENKKEISN